MPLPRQGKGGIDLATYTENYGLHQWEGTDDFLRTDFNTDFGIIDGALGEKVEIITGSYTGNNNDKSIDLGFQPAAVLLFTWEGVSHQSSTYGGLMTPSLSLRSNNGTVVAAEITENGFQIYGTSRNGSGTSIINVTYYYLAMRK